MHAQVRCFSNSSFSHCLRCAAVDSVLLKAIQEGSLSVEVMKLLEAKFREQTAANVPHEGSSPNEDVDSAMLPPPPPPLPPSSNSMVAASPTKWVIVSEKGQAKRWKESSGSQGLGSDPSGSSTPDDGSSHAAPMEKDPLQGMCNDLARISTSDEESHTYALDSKQHPLKGKVRKVAARERRPDKQDEEKIPLTCCGCSKVVAKASEFLLVHEGEGNCESWAGGHWGHCFECSRFNTEDFENEQAELAARKKFTNAAKKSWLATTKQYKELVIRARSMTWLSFKARLKREMPNASDDERRKLIQVRVQICVDT